MAGVVFNSLSFKDSKWDEITHTTCGNGGLQMKPEWTIGVL
jgi:hypothetical protein